MSYTASKPFGVASSGPMDVSQNKLQGDKEKGAMRTLASQGGAQRVPLKSGASNTNVKAGMSNAVDSNASNTEVSMLETANAANRGGVTGAGASSTATPMECEGQSSSNEEAGNKQASASDN
eukprot:9100943-Pyramimonas_sp.AAC.2